jgi:tetratricopeptide (TPR) repeat protein
MSFHKCFTLSFLNWTVFLAGLCCSPIVPAEYAHPEVEEVPVSRLIENLEKQVEQDEKNVVALHNLARAHGMVYASKKDTLPVWKGKDPDGVWFGYTPGHIPYGYALKNATDEVRMKAARAHLDEATAYYERAAELAPNDLGICLGHGWCLEQAGRKKEAIEKYRRVIDLAYEKDKKETRAPMGCGLITEEAARYLIPLLDKERDAKEIDEIQSKLTRLMRVPRWITPVAIPLRDGIGIEEMLSSGKFVSFDLDGSGLKRDWRWITPDGGWLVYISDRNQPITSAVQMLGNRAFLMFWENGFQAMAALDDDGDGRLSGVELVGLAVWRDANSNGVSEPGEVRTVSDWGILSLSCQWKMTPDGIPTSLDGVILRDGTTRSSYDLLLSERVVPDPK